MLVAEQVLNIDEIRGQFPILHQEVNGKPLIYFDNAATNQKPQRVIQALVDYYSGYNANIHRGIHTLAERATSAYEETREAVRAFLNAKEVAEVIFTKGTTDGINLVVNSFGYSQMAKGDRILISGMEHHSNIVPWQMLCEATGAHLDVVGVLEDGSMDMDEFEEKLTDQTKIVSIVYASNTLGTINPVQEIIKKSHSKGAKVFIAAAQASAHLTLDVQALDVDFMVLSAHKAYGPTGVGVLYGKREILDHIPPYQGGGEMIKDVTFEKTTYNELPYKFEAGTPNIAGVIAFKEAIAFINEIGKDKVKSHEDALLRYCTDKLSEIPEVKIIGTSRDKVAVASFIVEGVHHYDLGMWLDAKGIAVRTGHHCTQPLMDKFCIEGTARASFSVYNSFSEIDIFVVALKEIIAKFK